MNIADAMAFIDKHGKRIGRHSRSTTPGDTLKGPCNKLITRHHQYARSVQPTGLGGGINEGADRRFVEAALVVQRMVENDPAWK